MVVSILLLLPSIIAISGGNAMPSWPPQPIKKSFPGPWTILVGMQLRMGTTAITIGPAAIPIRGAIRICDVKGIVNGIESAATQAGHGDFAGLAVCGRNIGVVRDECAGVGI